LALSSGAIVQFFEKQKIVVSALIVVAAIILNLSFFREDIWYKVDDSFFTTGTEWIRERSASITDYWPLFGHEIPSVPGDGKYINYFPGWIGAVPDKNGLIPAVGTKFTNTPVRTIGNIISGLSIIGFTIIIAIKKKWKEEA
jgi:hypothetical protein